jgi:heptosyltransferase-1
MVNPTFQRVVFDATSRLTNHFPRAGARLLDATFKPAIGNRGVAWVFAKRNRRKIGAIRSLRRFLVVPDIHIGDVMFATAWLSALRDFFPDAHVDFVVNRVAASVVLGHPEASRIIPLFSGGSFPSVDDIARLKEIILAGRYDLCLNFSPFIPDSALTRPGQVNLNFMTHSAVLVRNERDHAEINHFMYQGYRFLTDLLSTVASPARSAGFRGVRTILSDEAITQAARFAADAGIASGDRVIQVNPDAASRFSKMPFDTQALLLRHLVTLEAVILIGAGHTDAGIGERLVESLPMALRARTRIIPADMPLDAYSALIDLSDVFITGDTGPLHLAASRRYSRSGTHQFRNRTAVLSLFGATTPRMSGYDSSQAGFLPANQDAPSWCYTAGSPCRNITCLNKMFKTCTSVRCFEEVDTEGLASLVGTYLAELPSQPKG